MCVHRGIAGRTRQVLSISVWDVLTSLWITEALSESKVNHVDVVLLLADANEEVVRLDISVQEVTRVYKLYTLQLYRLKITNRSASVTQCQSSVRQVRGVCLCPRVVLTIWSASMSTVFRENLRLQ